MNWHLPSTAALREYKVLVIILTVISLSLDNPLVSCMLMKEKAARKHSLRTALLRRINSRTVTRPIVSCILNFSPPAPLASHHWSITSRNTEENKDNKKSNLCQWLPIVDIGLTVGSNVLWSVEIFVSYRCLAPSDTLTAIVLIVVLVFWFGCCSLVVPA